ncbi:MAG: hypothetical protein P8P74_17590 [Crocinitomicaceae bacterium]|nr:hypothetical protein [Crocinitomicaceae bacterium]
MQASVKTLVLALIISSSAHSQSVTEWSTQHPEVLLIESQDASDELLDRLDQSSAKYIIYADELLMEDIENYHRKQSVSGLAELIDPTQEEVEFLKTWISQHSTTKIIRRSYYDSLDSEGRASISLEAS